MTATEKAVAVGFEPVDCPPHPDFGALAVDMKKAVTITTQMEAWGNRVFRAAEIKWVDQFGRSWPARHLKPEQQTDLPSVVALFRRGLRFVTYIPEAAVIIYEDWYSIGD